MIRKLRRQFILIASAALLLVMAVLVSVINATAYQIVNVFVDNAISNYQGASEANQNFISQQLLGPLNTYDVFYYVITADQDHQVISFDDSHNPRSLTESSAQQIINASLKADKNRFTYDGSYYAEFSETSGNTITYTIIDYSMIMRWVGQIRHISIIIGFLAFIIFEVLVIALSGKAIQPALRNAENQKRFITNASHELKTPVAVISADNQVIEAMHGSDEWTQSIDNQVKKLTNLINSLVQLSKSSEMGKVELSDVNVSEITEEHAESFRTLIESRNLKLEKNIQKDVHAKAEPKLLAEIEDILLDNAVKYCDENGMISIEALASGNHPVLIVSNDYKDGENVDYTKFFERFYREDTSHNSEKKGFGIGLSIADELTRSMQAKIKASWKEGRISFTVTMQ